MSLQICAPVSVIRNEKPNNSNNTCPYKTAKVRHLPQQIQSLSAQPPLPNVKHALAAAGASAAGDPGNTPLDARSGAPVEQAPRGFIDGDGAALRVTMRGRVELLLGRRS